MAQALEPILVPTADTGATTSREAPMVAVVDEHLVDLTNVVGACMPLGLEGGALADQLSAFITHERCGVHLYRSVAARTEVDDLRRTYEDFGDETLRHVEIYTELIAALGGDPQYVSAAARATEKANAALLQTTFMITGSADPATRELAMIEAVAIAETKCHANWALLDKLAAALPDGPVRSAIEAAVAEVQPQEDEHLTWATTARERFLLGLIAPSLDIAEPTATYVDVVEENAEHLDEVEAVEEVEEDEYAAATADLASMTKSELYERAQELDIPGRSSMTKDELAEALREFEEE